MPYKSEKINIKNSIYDRRQKLSDEQKEYIRWLREEYGYSYNQLAKMFGVSKRLMIFVCNPEKYDKSREQLKARKADGRYKPSKKEWAKTMREHRHYKQNLYNSGKINGINDMTLEDYDYKDLLQDYGNEYLQEHDADDCIYEMDMITEYITDVWEALRGAFFGYDWCPGADSDSKLREQFNPNKEYFAFNGYGNLVSIDDYYYIDWLESRIDEDSFIDWCEEQGYIDEIDEDEE